MKRRYRILPDSHTAPSDAEITRYRDTKRLLFNYQKAVHVLHRKPLYKDPKAFLVLLIIVLMAILVAESRNDRVDIQRDAQDGMP